LWNLHYDAKPEVLAWAGGDGIDTFVGSHQGYLKLAKPLRPIRSFVLDHMSHSLTVIDHFVGRGEHALRIPLHLVPGASVREREAGVLEIENNGRRFLCVVVAGGLGSVACTCARLALLWSGDTLYMRSVDAGARPTGVAKNHAHAGRSRCLGSG
jgi:hypothetical protein